MLIEQTNFEGLIGSTDGPGTGNGGGQCGSKTNTICQTDESCSLFGWCGKDPIFTEEATCQREYSGDTSKCKLTNRQPGMQCGPNNFCQSKESCSYAFWCGQGSDFSDVCLVAYSGDTSVCKNPPPPPTPAVNPNPGMTCDYYHLCQSTESCSLDFNCGPDFTDDCFLELSGKQSKCAFAYAETAPGCKLGWTC